MKEADRQRIIDRKVKRDRDLQERVAARKLKRSGRTIDANVVSARTEPSITHSSQASENDAVVSASNETLKNAVKNYVDEYTAAQAEIETQRNRLIALRGGEDNLTEEDLEALENIRDLVAKRYEQYLET